MMDGIAKAAGEVGNVDTGGVVEMMGMRSAYLQLRNRSLLRGFHDACCVLLVFLEKCRSQLTGMDENSKLSKDAT